MIKCLIVEDDQRVADFIQEGLLEKGYLVELSPEGYDAIEKIQLLCSQSPARGRFPGL